MPTDPNVPPTPSIEEFIGYYNIPDNDGLEYPVIRSASKVPESSFAELSDVYHDAKKWLSLALPPVAKASFDPISEDDFEPRWQADYRTLVVDGGDYQ